MLWSFSRHLFYYKHTYGFPGIRLCHCHYSNVIIHTDLIEIKRVHKIKHLTSTSDIHWHQFAVYKCCDEITDNFLEEWSNCFFFSGLSTCNVLNKLLICIHPYQQDVDRPRFNDAIQSYLYTAMATTCNEDKWIVYCCDNASVSGWRQTNGHWNNYLIGTLGAIRYIISRPGRVAPISIRRVSYETMQPMKQLGRISVLCLHLKVSVDG